MKLATSTGDLLYYCDSPEQAVRMFEGTGFTHLDFSFWRMANGDKPLLQKDWMKPIEKAAKAAEQLGIDFVQAHSPSNNFLNAREDFDTVVLANVRSIEACGYLGIPNIVVHSGSSHAYRYPGDMERYFEANRRFYESLYPAMEKYNVRVLLENGATANMGDQCFPMTGQELADFIGYLGHPLLGACWDVGHANLQDPDQYKDFVAMGSVLKAVHIQDNFGKRDDHLAPFMGTLDIDAVMRGLTDGGFIKNGGVFTFECDNILKQFHNTKPCADSPAKLAGPTAVLKREAICLLYKIGCEILTAYDIPVE